VSLTVPAESLGSFGEHLSCITLERYKIACSRINLKLKSIVMEEFVVRKDQLFDSGFLERASKKEEIDKALDKVVEIGPHYKIPENSGDHCIFCIQRCFCQIQWQEGPVLTWTSSGTGHTYMYLHTSKLNKFETLSNYLQK